MTMSSIVAGNCIQLSPLVRRITAPNPSVMTGAGTNTYLIGRDQIAVIDPGPAEPSHIEAILEATGGQISWILATHTHKDHSPAAQLLAQQTAATVMGRLLDEDDGFQDQNFKPDQALTHNQRLEFDGFSLQVLHTPGHVDNHLCYMLEQEGMLFTGDHIMQGSTVVIIPPHGDMKAYINSLQLLLDYPLTSLAPGHGELIKQPVKEVKRIIDHRLAREQKIIVALSQFDQVGLTELTTVAYDDVDPALHKIASYSLWAHLLKLQEEGAVDCVDEQWRYLK